jgi:hypothetical protein
MGEKVFRYGADDIVLSRIEASSKPDGTMKTAALLLLAVASAAGHAAADEPDAGSLENALANVASALAGRSDPDCLAAAALFAKLTDATRAEQLAARASAAAPTRADLLWLHAQLCHDVQGCDRVALDARLHELDPENGAVFIPRLQNAGGPIDAAETDRLLAAAARSRRIDFYWNPLVAHLVPPVLATKALQPSQALIAVIGAASAVVIPPLAGAGVPCRDWMPREDRRDECQAIARALLAGDTVMAQIAGTNLTLKLWPSDSREALAAKETQRTLLYQASANGAQSASRLADEGGVRRYLDKMARYRREQDVIVAEIVAAGGRPTPPADWRPPPPQQAAPAPAIR